MLNKKYSIFIFFMLSISCSTNIPPLDTTGWPVFKNNKSDSVKKLSNRDLNPKVTKNVYSNIDNGNTTSQPNTNNSYYSPVGVSQSTTPSDSSSETSDIKDRATINGRIFDTDGNLITDAIVKAKSIDNAVTWESEEQHISDGLYIFRNVPTGVRIQITVKIGQNTPITQTIVSKANLNGNTSQNEYNFSGTYAIDYRPLEGRIYDGDGKIITSNVEVTAESLVNGKPWSEVAEFNNGLYKFKKIPLEVHSIKVTVKANGKIKSRSYDISGQGPYYLSFGGKNENDKDFAIKSTSSNKILASDLNKFISAGLQANSTFSVDVDTASYTLMRNSVVLGNSLPSRGSVRIEEFVNYFDYKYTRPEKGFSINTEVTNSPFTNKKDKNMKLLRVGLQTPTFNLENRKNISVTFVIDVSGSMLEDNKLETIKNSIKIFLKQLNKDDRISIVTYNNNSSVIIDDADISKENQIIGALDWLKADNKTDIEEGLKKGSIIAQKNFRNGYTNKIILCSDGINNMGDSDAKRILENIKKQSEISNISISSVGVGFSKYNDNFLEQIAINGDGYYAYIDSYKEAVKVFVEQITNTFQIIAKDVKVQVKFNKDKVDSYRLLGYENKTLAYSDFRNNDVQAGEIGPNHSVTALYELEVNDKVSDNTDLANVTLRYKDPDNNDAVIEVNKNISSNEIIDYDKSSYSFRLASVVALYGEILRGSYWYLENDLNDVIQNIAKIIPESNNDEKVKEFKNIVDKAYSIEQKKSK